MASSVSIIERHTALLHRVLSPLVPHGSFALLDFPNYANVGDSAIWLGELAYFERYHHLRPSYVASLDDFDAKELELAVPSGPVFLNGGGNFGDMWPAHQHFREMIIARYPDRPIFQLPQSIHFQDQGNLKRTASIINAHRNLTLLVRDRRSFDLAKSWFKCRVELAPDMAFAIGPIKRAAKPNADLLYLLRTDCERRSPNGSAAEIVQDWLDEPSDTHRRARNRSIRLLPTLGYRSLDRNARRELRYRNLAEDRVRRGVNQLSSFEYVITDRLHAHILCTLLDLPHTILDNSYGKVLGFADQWSEGLSLLRTATTLDDAVEEWKRRRTEHEAH